MRALVVIWVISLLSISCKRSEQPKTTLEFSTHFASQQYLVAYQEFGTVAPDDSLSEKHGFGPGDVREIGEAVAGHYKVKLPEETEFDTPRELAAIIDGLIAGQNAPEVAQPVAEHDAGQDADDHAGADADADTEANRLKPDPLYTKVKPHHDGIGKVFLGREISQIMGHQAAGWLERPEREREERTDIAVKALKLKPGEVVADIGCGTGYYASRMAKEVGPDGLIYGVEIQQEMLDLLAKYMKAVGVTNVKGHMGEPDNPKLPAESCDMIIMVDVYHEFEFPYEMMRHMIKALKPGGRMVFIEYRKEDPTVMIKVCHKMSQAQVKKEVAVHPELEWVETFDGLPTQHLIVFKKR